MFERSQVDEPGSGSAQAPPTNPPPPQTAVVPFDAEALWGPATISTVLMLLTVDPASLSPDDALCGVVGQERVRRWLDAVGMRLMAVAAGTEPKAAAVDSAAAEIACAVDLNPQSVASQVAHARAVVARLPVTLDALERGSITAAQARMVQTLTSGLSDELAGSVEAAAVPGNPRRLKMRVLREIARLAPEYARKVAESKRRDRIVEFWNDQEEGVSGMHVQGPADQVAIIKAAIDAEARQRVAGECRPIATRRFDALLGWARHALGLGGCLPEHVAHTAAEPEGEPHPVTGCSVCTRPATGQVGINVTVPLASLLRLSETPGDLDGLPIDAEAARELAADNRWRLWLTEDGTGRLLDVGAGTYRPGAVTQRFVRGRDRTCRFPNCGQPAVRCDLDHTKAFHTEGGETVCENLCCLCRHHHRLKHEEDWSYHLEPNGDVPWTAPSGRTYVTLAEHPGDHDVLSAHFADAHARERRREEAATVARAEQVWQAERRRVAAVQQNGVDARDPWLAPPDPKKTEPPPW